MIVEQKLQSLGLVVPDLEQDYATNPSGARFISHYALQNVLYLSGTAPVKDGKPYRPGVVGKDLTVEQGMTPHAMPCSPRSPRSSTPWVISIACSR
jgi:hypothetical protein